MTPTSTLSATLAIDTQKCGTPRAKFAVPSIGSTTHAAPASRATACAASSRMSMSVEAPLIIVSPSKMAVGAVLKDDRIAVRSDELGWPPTFDRFADERQRHPRSRGRSLEGGRRFTRRRGQKLIVVAARRRNFEQIIIVCDRRARRRRQRQT